MMPSNTDQLKVTISAHELDWTLDKITHVTTNDVDVVTMSDRYMRDVGQDLQPPPARGRVFTDACAIPQVICKWRI